MLLKTLLALAPAMVMALPADRIAARQAASSSAAAAPAPSAAPAPAPAPAAGGGLTDIDILNL